LKIFLIFFSAAILTAPRLCGDPPNPRAKQVSGCEQVFGLAPDRKKNYVKVLCKLGAGAGRR